MERLIVWGVFGWLGMATLGFDVRADEKRPLTPPAFGHTIAAQGDLLLVSAPFASGGKGKVYLFRREGEGHRLVATLVSPTPFSTNTFGKALAIDRKTLAVGDEGANLGFTSGAGLAYLYELAGAVPGETPQRLFPPSPERLSGFGETIALHAELAAIGESARYDGGSVTVFRRKTGKWMVETKLNAAQFGDDSTTVGWFGRKVAMNETTLVVTAPWTKFDEVTSGAVYVFHKKEGRFTDSPTTLTWKKGREAVYFGDEVILHDGLLAVGAAMADVGDREAAGAVCLYAMGPDGRFPGEPTAVLTSPVPRKNEAFGAKLALGESFVAVGTSQGEGGQRGVHIWEPNAQEPKAWTRVTSLKGEDEDAEFGSWGLAASGSLIYVGEPYPQPYGKQNGQVAVIAREVKDGKPVYRRIETIRMPD